MKLYAGAHNTASLTNKSASKSGCDVQHQHAHSCPAVELIKLQPECAAQTGTTFEDAARRLNDEKVPGVAQMYRTAKSLSKCTMSLQVMNDELRSSDLEPF